MRDGVRDRVNVTIDPKLKRLFEDLQQRHQKTWTEILEKGVREMLVEVDPVQALEYEIKILQEKQEEKSAALIRARANIEAMKIQSTDKEKEAEEKEKQLHKFRLEKFEHEFKELEKQWRTNYLNWNRIIDFGKFQDMREAKKWLEKELKAREIMERHVHYQ